MNQAALNHLKRNDLLLIEHPRGSVTSEKKSGK